MIRRLLHDATVQAPLGLYVVRVRARLPEVMGWDLLVETATANRGWLRYGTSGVGAIAEWSDRIPVTGRITVHVDLHGPAPSLPPALVSLGYVGPA